MLKPLFPEWQDLQERADADAEIRAEDDEFQFRRVKDAPRVPRTRVEIIGERARLLGLGAK